METARQTNSSEAAKEAVSLSSISVVIRGSQQRPFSPKSEAQKLSPMAKPWRPRLRASGEMPPMLKTMAAKLKHGRSHNMLATWQKSGKTTKTVFEPESLTKSRKNALVQKGDCVSPVAKASDHCVVRKPGEIRHRKARRNTDFGPLLHTVGEQQKTRRTSSAALVEMARRHSVDGDISNKTVFDRDHQRTVGLNRCKDISSSNWLQRSVQEPDGMRTSGTCQDTGRNVMGRTPGTVSTDKYPEDTAAGHTRGCIMKCAGLAQSPLLSADSTDSDHSAFTSVALPHSPGGDRTASVWSHKLKDTRTVHKTPSHESLALVLTEAWRRPTSQHAVGSSTMSLQGKGHPQLTKLAGKESLKQPLVGQNPWSRHGSGQRDLALAGQDTLSRRCSSQRDLALAGQDTRSRHGSGQGNPSLAGQDTRSRHGSGQGNPSLAGQDTRSRHGSGRGNPSLAGHDTWSRRGSGKGNSSLAGQETRSRHGSGQGDSPLVTGLMPQYGVNAMDKAEREHVTPLVTTALTFNTKAADATYTQLWDKSCVDSQTDPRLRSPDERSRIHPLSVADLCTVTPMIPFEQTRCETEHSDTDWGKLIPVNLSQDAWNTSDFCVACEMMSSITKEYSSKPPQERHQVMLVYSAKLKKTLQQSDDDEMFAESTSSMLSYSSTRDTHSPARRKKHLERQKLYKVLADIKTSVTADKVKIASMPLPDKEIHRRVDWSRLDCEIINERLGQWNRFHMDQQIQVLPQILRLSSESDKYISVEGQFLFMRVRPIQLGHCNELYALKVIIEAVYEELSLMSERGASDSRKDWLLLALGWLHTHRRQKLTEICHHDAQHVCELAELFQQRRAWYRKMQAELQKSPRQDSAISLLDDPLKYLARRIGTMTKYLEFIQNLSSCTYHAMSMNNTKDGISTCAKTLLQESAAQWAGRDKSVAVKPEAANMTRSSRDNIVRSVCLPRATSGCRTEAHGVDAEECCYDNADIDDICHKEAADHGEEGDTDGEFFSDHDFIEDIGHVEDSIEDVIDDESDKAEGPVKSGESGAKAACSENDADIIDAESDKSKESDESGAQHARCESNADIIDADIIDADIIDAESDMSKENGQSDIVATCSEIHVKESDDDIIEAENGRSNESEESDIVAAIRESESTENYNDVINGESDKLKENDQHEERDAKAHCCQSDAKENDGDIIDDENDLSKGSSQCEESSVPTACSDSHGKENDDDTNFTEIAMSLQSLCEDSVVAADCCESRCKEDDDAQSDVPKRSEESDACHGSLFQESDSEVNSSSNSPGGNGHVEDIYDSENQVQRTVDDIKDADNTSGQCENQEIQNDLAETVRSVGKGDVSETEHSATEAGCHGGRSHGEEDEDPVNNTNCAVSQTDRHMEESSTTGDTTSQLRESESRLIESENSIYESISDVEDMEDEDDVCQEDNSVNIYCGRSNANIVEYVYHVVKSESMLRHAEDSISGEVRGENSKRNNGDVYTTSKHKVFQPNSCAEVKSIGVVLNMKSQVFCPEVKSIGVIMNGSVSHSGLAPDCSGRPCIEDMLASVEDSTGQAERVHMPTLCAIPREATIPSTTTVNQGTGSAAKKRKHNEKTKRRHREKRLRTDLVAVENDSPAVAERNVSKGTDDSGVRRYDDRRLSGFTGKSLSETQLHKSCYECNAVTNPAYYTNCTVKGHHRDGDTLRMKWQGDERPWSANDISSTHAMDRFFMSKNLHHNEAPWFDEEHGIHREPEGRGHRHRHRKDHKRHRHTRWEHSWKPH